MGSGPSQEDKKELEDLKRREEEQRRENQKEFDELKARQRRQEAEMEAEVDRKRRAHEKLQEEALAQMKQNEEEMRELRRRQEQKAKELEKTRAAEVEKARNESAAEKKKVEEEYARKAAELKKEQDEEVRRANAERDAEKKRRDAEVKEADEERKAALRENAEKVKNHRAQIDEMNKKHREVIEEHYKRMEAFYEQCTKNEIARIVETTNEQLAIVDKNYERVKRDAIETKYRDFFRDFQAIKTRGEKLQNTITDMESELQIIQRDNEVTYEIRGLNSEFQTESTLLNKHLADLRGRMKTCLDISDEFKQQLMEPFQSYEESCPSIQGVSFKIITAGHRNDVRSLEPVGKILEKHKEVLTTTIQAIKDVKYEPLVRAAIQNMTNLSITQS